MSSLKIFAADQPATAELVSDYDEIATRLHHIGIRFERWQASQSLADGAGQDEVMAAYQDQVNQLMDEYGFQSSDVISLTADHPDRQMLRKKFLDEHTHSDFEVRFFVEGRGLFYMHAEDQVFAVMCEQGDLISVPAGLKHWFDMGEAPAFRCIRFFTTPEGWVASFTGDAIAKSFPTFEEFLAA